MRYSFALIVALTSLTAGCASRFDFPPLGDPLPISATLTIPASIKELRADYMDLCGHPMREPLGTRLDAALIEASSRTFQSVTYGEKSGNAAAALVHFDLADWSFQLQHDRTEKPGTAHIQLHVRIRVSDHTGTLLRASDILVTRQAPLRLEPVQDECAYRLDPLLQEVSVELATKFAMEARQAFSGLLPAKLTTGLTPPPPASPVPTAPSPAAAATLPSKVRFTSMLLDENGSLTLEGGERFRVRVDVANTGSTPVHQARVLLSGPDALLRLFPSTSLTLPPLQPGEVKSVEFLATLPPAIPLKKAELQVTVEESATQAQAQAPAQILAIALQPTGIKADDVDQIPAAAMEFRQPQTYLISIGVSSYRDQRLLPRTFASLDAEMVAAYFIALGGLPASNVRVLQDWTASRSNIDEALLTWLPPQMTKEAVVIVYFSGQAMVDHDGTVLLVPYDGSPTATTRMYSLKDLESALSRLKAKHTILLFDGMVSRLHSDPKTKHLPPRWDSGGASTIRLISGEALGAGLEDDKHHHGLFTYYLLRALRGEADSNRDGAVTLGELSGYVSQKVVWAAKTQFAVDQHPSLFPSAKSDHLPSALVLSKLAAIRGEPVP
ncbi:MAG: caspase family protein [Nitrospira sp.]|jgi:hypothetical protein|nr:caspase family protein [Nitrospira sp.]